MVDRAGVPATETESMSNSIDLAGCVREFLNKAGPQLEHLANPFDYPVFDAGNMATMLPVGVRGKLSSLRETLDEIASRFVRERGWLKQTSFRGGGSTEFDSAKLEFDRNEEKERSNARERWFCELTTEEKSAFDK